MYILCLKVHKTDLRQWHYRLGQMRIRNAEKKSNASNTYLYKSIRRKFIYYYTKLLFRKHIVLYRSIMLKKYNKLCFYIIHFLP